MSDTNEEMKSLESKDEEKLKAQKEVPIYQHSLAYAREHNEFDAYDASFQTNIGCKQAIETAIAEHFKDNRLEAEEAVEQVVEQFGYERTFYILAVTVKDNEADNRISHQNRAWARTIPLFEDTKARYFVVNGCHPGLLDIFLKVARENWEKDKSATTNSAFS